MGHYIKGAALATLCSAAVAAAAIYHKKRKGMMLVK